MKQTHYSTALKKWGLYWICHPSVILCLWFCHSVTLSDEIFRLTFLRNYEAYKVETWQTMGGCIMYTSIRVLLLIHLFDFSFFHSNVQTFFFVTLFSGTVKLGTHMDNSGCIVCTRIRLLLLICPFISSFFFLQFSNIKIFRHTFLRNYEAYNLVHTCTMGGCIVYTGISCGCCLFVPS